MVMYFYAFLDHIQSGYYTSTVSSTPNNAILETEILREPDNHNGYGTDLGGGDTVELLLYLQQRFGPVSSFSGSYRADRWEINIHRTAGMKLKMMYNNIILSRPKLVLYWHVLQCGHAGDINFMFSYGKETCKHLANQQ